jgi:hypothetical protein
VTGFNNDNYEILTKKKALSRAFYSISLAKLSMKLLIEEN